MYLNKLLLFTLQWKRDHRESSYFFYFVFITLYGRQSSEYYLLRFFADCFYLKVKCCTGWVKSSVSTFSESDFSKQINVFSKTKNTVSKSYFSTWFTTLNHLNLTDGSKDIIKSLESSETRSMGKPCISMGAVKTPESQWRNAFPMAHWQGIDKALTITQILLCKTKPNSKT